MKVTFFANSQSPHVRQWVQMASNRVDLTIIDICRSSKLMNELNNVTILYPLPRWTLYLPKVLQYIFLGVWIRIYWQNSQNIQAHNASGYGLVALLSGHKFSLTIYGSELFSLSQQSIIFRTVVLLAIRKAHTVYTSSSYAKNEVEKYVTQQKNIIVFPHGVAEIFEQNQVVRSKNQHVWFVNRRIAPLYNTEILIDAFVTYKNDYNGKGKLLVLEGDSSNQDYLNSVKHKISMCESIELISGFVDQRTLVQYLDQSTFCISIPDTDQLSMSIIESMCRGCIPVLHDLESYSRVSDIATLLPHKAIDKDTLTQMFIKTSQKSNQDIAHCSMKAIELVKQEFSMRVASNTYIQFLDA